MSVHGELNQVLCELELVSQVSAMNMDPTGGPDASESIGGKRPPGGVQWKDESLKNPEVADYPQRGVEYFRRRLKRAHSDEALAAILADARVALAAARRAPMPNAPGVDDPQRNRWIAESKRSNVQLAAQFGLTPQRVGQIRKDYRPAAVKVRRPRMVEHCCEVCGTVDCVPGSSMCPACLEFAELRASKMDPFVVLPEGR